MKCLKCKRRCESAAQDGHPAGQLCKACLEELERGRPGFQAVNQGSAS